VIGGASKSNTPLFAGSVSKKGQAKPALFWSKVNATPRQTGKKWAVIF
jgi:hypothetical protein